MSAAALSAHVVVERAEFTVEVSLEVAPGGVLALLGPSGAGKSTVLDALAGLTRLSGGRIELGGEILGADRGADQLAQQGANQAADQATVLADAASGLHLAPSRRRVGRLSQAADLFPHLSALDNVAFAIEARGVSRPGARDVARQWLERIDLSQLADRRPAELSGGQARRVALARALAAEPKLLLMDEPFVSLDALAAADMIAVIREQLANQPTTLVVVTHELRHARALTDEALVLEVGRETYRGSIDAMVAAPSSAYVEALAE